MPIIPTEEANGKTLRFPVSLFHNEREIKLDFPLEWDLVECRMAGHDLPSLTDGQIRKAFENPIGSARIYQGPTDTGK